MTNLLPPEERGELILKNRERLAIVLGLIVLIFLVCLILILLSIRFYILTNVISQKNILNQVENNYKTPEFIKFKDTIQKHNNNIIRINSFYEEEIYFSPILKIISNIPHPDGVYLTELSLNRDNENKKLDITVSGFSNFRENLLVFKKNIEENKEIKEPYFSPESWTNPQGVRFYLAFKIYQNEE